MSPSFCRWRFEPFKCGANERRRRGLDRGKPYFLPLAKMQTNLQRVTTFHKKKHSEKGAFSLYHELFLTGNFGLTDRVTDLLLTATQLFLL